MKYVISILCIYMHRSVVTLSCNLIMRPMYGPWYTLGHSLTWRDPTSNPTWSFPNPGIRKIQIQIPTYEKYPLRLYLSIIPHDSHCIFPNKSLPKWLPWFPPIIAEPSNKCIRVIISSTKNPAKTHS